MNVFLHSQSTIKWIIDKYRNMLAWLAYEVALRFGAIRNIDFNFG